MLFCLKYTHLSVLVKLSYFSSQLIAIRLRMIKYNDLSLMQRLRYFAFYVAF